MNIECTFTNTPVISIKTGFQYDTGQTLKINGLQGLPARPEVHFTYDGSTASAGVYLGTYADGVLTCPIPDPIMRHVFWRAFVYVPTATSATTEFAVNVQLKERPPRGEPLSENEITLASQLVGALNELNGIAEDAAAAALASAAAAAISAEESEASSELQPASASVLGGIKVGANLAIADGVLSIDTTALQTYIDTVILGGAS